MGRWGEVCERRGGGGVVGFTLDEGGGGGVSVQINLNFARLQRHEAHHTEQDRA